MARVFKTTLLDRCLRRKARENEQFRRRTLARLLKALPGLAKKYGIDRALIFGSLAQRGRYSERSDIDIAVSDLSDADFFRFGAELSDCMGHEVDVIQIERHRLARKIPDTAIEWKRTD